MIGFVSALSSSLAIIILIMSVMMLNMLQSAQVKDEPTKMQINIKSAKETEEKTLKDGVFHELNNNILTAEMIELIKSRPSVNKLHVQCDYGFSIDFDTAKRYTTFNAMIVFKKFPGITLETNEPELNEKEKNRCFIKYE